VTVRRTHDPTFFFLHVMKTGGTSLRHHIRDNFGDDRIDPPRPTRMPDTTTTSNRVGYDSLDRLRALTPERRAQVRVYMGHFPFVATELVEHDVTLTLLRNPVDRTVSVLRHMQREEPAKRGLSLEEIYDDPWRFAMLIHDYQAKMFALSWDDNLPDQAHLAGLDIDDRRLQRAKENLASVDVVGVQDRFEELTAELHHRFGWRFVADHRHREASGSVDAPHSLRRRIAADNAADMDLYQFALQLIDQQTRTG
jgi:hypothetical protein